MTWRNVPPFLRSPFFQQIHTQCTRVGSCPRPAGPCAVTWAGTTARVSSLFFIVPELFSVCLVTYIGLFTPLKLCAFCGKSLKAPRGPCRPRPLRAQLSAFGPIKKCAYPQSQGAVSLREGKNASHVILLICGGFTFCK